MESSDLIQRARQLIAVSQGLQQELQRRMADYHMEIERRTGLLWQFRAAKRGLLRPGTQMKQDVPANSLAVKPGDFGVGCR